MTSLVRIAVAVLACASTAWVNLASAGEAADSGQQAAERLLQAMKAQSQPSDWPAACKAIRQDWKTGNLPAAGATIGGYWLDRPDELAKLSFPSMCGLSESLHVLLRDDWAADAWCLWLEKGGASKLATPKDLLRAARELGHRATEDTGAAIQHRWREDMVAGRLLAEQASQMVLSKSEKLDLKSADCPLDLVAQVGSWLGEKERAVLADRIDRAMSEQAASIQGLSPDQMSRLASSLLELGQPAKALEVVVAWAKGTAWQSARPGDLAVFLRAAQAGSSAEAKGLCSKLAEQSLSLLMKPSALDGLAADKLGLVIAVAPLLKEAERRQLCQPIEKEFLLATTSGVSDGVMAISAMKLLVGWADAGGIVAGAAAKTDFWMSLPIEKLAEWAFVMGHAESPDAADAKQKMAAFAWKTYLDPAAAASIRAPELCDLIHGTCAVLSTEQRGVLVPDVLKKLTASSQYTAQLKFRNLQQGFGLSDLEEYRSIGDVTVAWMKASDRWKSASLFDLARIGVPFTGKAVRVKFKPEFSMYVDFVRGKGLISELEMVRQQAPDEWLLLVMQLSTATGLTGADQAAVANIVTKLYMEEGLASRLSVSSLRTLAGVVQSVKADSARAGLAGHVWQTYLGNEAFMSSAPCGDVCGLVSAAAFALSKEQCDATTARIEKRFASDEAASQGLSPAEATLVAQALDALKASR